jgi:predicted secreted acid phosphatase|tara:strand:+ start:21507 stop:21722 length:216 start_codon:yes stop_codon:yes gene_type:complete
MPGPYAIITDLVETALSNANYYGQRIIYHAESDLSSWRAWVELEGATPISGVLEFLNYAHQRDVSIFYITH